MPTSTWASTSWRAVSSISRRSSCSWRWLSPHINQIQRQRYQARLDEVRDYLASIRKRQFSADNGDQGQQGRGR